MQIESAGYDAQCELLEVRFLCDGQVWQYTGVPEEVWYSFKGEAAPDMFFHKHIKGCFDEKRILFKKNN
nr:KTSC domain-containing protein [uncultured Acetatifactor sp.]